MDAHREGYLVHTMCTAAAALCRQQRKGMLGPVEGGGVLGGKWMSGLLNMVFVATRGAIFTNVRWICFSEGHRACPYGCGHPLREGVGNCCVSCRRLALPSDRSTDRSVANSSQGEGLLNLVELNAQLA